MAMRDSAQKRQILYDANKAWTEGCKTDLQEIVGHQAGYSHWDDYSNTAYHSPNILELKMNTDQKIFDQNHTTVMVEVPQTVYNRLKNKDATRIYYLPESPLTFLLEEEI
jgi:hypothetical protein